jgi:hypothetical protein
MREKQDHHVTLRVSAPVRAAIERVADQDRRTFADAIRVLLDAGIAQWATRQEQLSKIGAHT